MNQKQVEKILKDRINIGGIAKDILTRVANQKVKIIKVKDFPKVRFVDNGDGTITDTHLGLTWVKNPHTDLPDKFKNTMVWKNAIDVCKELDFAGRKDWRLPTVKELHSIVDYFRGAKDNKPTINTKLFPDTKCSWYWTSTPCAWYSGHAWIVYFYSGLVYSYYKGSYSYVRPVRSSQ